MHNTMTDLIPWEEFVDTYKPVWNNKLAPLDGFMFETYGAEFKRVREAGDKNIQNIWTVIDSDGRLTAAPAMHSVNRLGYLITENEWTDEEIVVDAE
jgi:hypothetical protein